jgi:similar to stage IV sporulation protein
MLKKLIHWLRGILVIQIGGIAPERFINLCCNRRINIWDLRKKEEAFQFHILASDYKKLKPIARKTKILPRIIRKSGMPFFLHRYRKRKVFFGGVILCLIFIYILSLYIWDISFLGTGKHTPEALTKFLTENHIYTGILKSKVNCQEIEETMRLTYTDIGWVSAEIKGTRLIIKIKETNMPISASKAIKPSHMVATKDAIIKSLITRSGTPMVSEGDVVKKGDILVSGIVNIMGDFEEILGKEVVIADADIRCKTYYDYRKSFSMNYTKKNYSGREKKGYYLNAFQKKLFLYNPRNSYPMYDIIVNEKKLHITDSFYLPFSFGGIVVREYDEVKLKYHEEEAIRIANARLERYINELIENDVLIIENNVKITFKDNNCIASGRIVVEEPAWKYRTIQENEWRIEPTDEHSGDNH